MKQLTALILLISLFSCISNNKDQNKKVSYIKDLIAEVGFIDLPYTHDLMICDEISRHNIDKNSLDSLYFDDFNGFIVGVLPDTTVFYCFLYFGVGDDLYPCLTTIDKKGNKIDSKGICIGQCAGMMIDYDTCIDRVKINKDFSFDMFYHLQAIVEEEGEGNKFDTICNEMIWTGRISKKGEIFINESDLKDCI